ncbi:MAG: hypothetical protein P4L95_18550 [Rouxiella aceris]|jgi:hypothetical protein|uniref:Uncharacterized protein n=1 Tax=Rouxiella aceris TaxID=2703884 RepID=A0A848MK64_9GAMM|nr:hypothetical protein [Rouxiella aceris]MDR3433875.1 hypothetical protein [Rouxiella aceris]NMP28878.1 hypothetical protein [Rouxiella aceris]
MSQVMFEQAPLPLFRRFTPGDNVTLKTFPVGNPPVSYRLEAKIIDMGDDNFEAEIIRVLPLGRENFTQQHFHPGGHVEFQKGNILGNAP